MSSTLKNSTSLFTLSARIRSAVFGLVTALIVTSCMPLVHFPGKPVVSPVLGERFFLTADGARLPVRSWMPENGRPKGLVIAVHGFNDYSNFFSSSGEFLSELGIASYAFDQRGFGDSPDAGLWFGVEAYVNDLVEFSRLVSHKHPSLPVYLLGESMGGAVVIVAMNSASPPEIDGVILSAPAVWGRETMPWYQRALLWFTVHTMPWMKLTGEGLEITPSDNIEMLRQLGRDPLVIKETRVEAIYGLVNLMDNALQGFAKLKSRLLILYGEKDEVIPQLPVMQALQMLPTGKAGQAVSIAFYENGYHMLLRDLQRRIPLLDIADWIEFPGQALPSGADMRGLKALEKLASEKRAEERL